MRLALVLVVAMMARPSATAAQQPPPPTSIPAAPHQHEQTPTTTTTRPPAAPLPSFIPPLTDADRAAAFPDVGSHMAHESRLNYFVLFDELEWQAGAGVRGVSWDSKGWIGGDGSRFWFRTEGHADRDRVDDAQVHALYGRSISRWWDLVGGVRQDMRPGRAQTWAAVGVQGLAPYRFEVEATAYVGASVRTHVRLETEYQLLLTNRLVLQPLVELDVYGKSDAERGIGAGLSSMGAGLRVRYEIRRELAPYVGVTWDRKYFRTAVLARASGENVGGLRLVAGWRLWR